MDGRQRLLAAADREQCGQLYPLDRGHSGTELGYTSSEQCPRQYPDPMETLKRWWHVRTLSPCSAVSKILLGPMQMHTKRFLLKEAKQCDGGR